MSLLLSSSLVLNKMFTNLHLHLKYYQQNKTKQVGQQKCHDKLIRANQKTAILVQLRTHRKSLTDRSLEPLTSICLNYVLMETLKSLLCTQETQTYKQTKPSRRKIFLFYCMCEKEQLQEKKERKKKFRKIEPECFHFLPPDTYQRSFCIQRAWVS